MAAHRGAGAHPLTLLSQVVGGVGVFLLGMILLSDGLKAVAGDALRRTLERFTGGRLSAVASGAAVTALVQSSSATTITTIGFVSAGLLTFPAAVGVIFGANLGTSSTGWIVSLLGLKFKIGAVALPLVAAGALLRLLGRGRWSGWGLALAGFGLIFVGIDLLQVGMSGLAEGLDPGRFQIVGWSGRWLLLGIGLVMTVVMQSSSAAVATTLTALHSGALTLEQGALLVIGQNVGTTVTAGLAALGGSVPARRTALAHVLFNGLTGVVAIVVLPWVLNRTHGLSLWMNTTDPAVALAAFHTGFNLMGVALLLPVVEHFSRMVEWMVPERGPVLGRHLDRSLLPLPSVALSAARRVVAEVALVTTARSMAALQGRPPDREAEEALERATDALVRTREFLRGVEATPDSESEAEYTRHISVLHALDHQDRLLETLGEKVPSVARADLAPLASRALPTLGEFCRWLDQVVSPPGGGSVGDDPDLVARLEEAASQVVDERRRHRRQILERTAAGEMGPVEAQLRMATVRWGDRLVYHIWRTAVHLAEEGERVPGTGPGVEGPSGEPREVPPSAAVSDPPAPPA